MERPGFRGWPGIRSWRPVSEVGLEHGADDAGLVLEVEVDDAFPDLRLGEGLLLRVGVAAIDQQ